ncbi:DUF2953 domain-containing protein [Aquibacillus sp. 3ASR75-11]|uniref:DUF2953 domain-containing protein n=1 Tax=Terrihalobacillus insolitus TaxID=2950438 RepID=A0A9X4AL48_9BACI|nr:DUF2953 domain-containing protein [Terrihalobacillus insolitus]MDC3412662.1 DUF2953 domain-containing protein [Terrihalobacillus insolitus]MDC3424012.1 DUF2953 domain-containing protein [Terrihalobacillus insolitus]
MGWIYFTLIFLFLLIMILLFRVYVTIHYIYEDNENKLVIKIHLWKIPMIHKTIDLNDEMWSEIEKTTQNIPEREQEINSVEAIFNKIKSIKNKILEIFEMKPLFLPFIKKIHINQFSWKSKIGTGNAGSTGMVCGGVWTMKGGITGILHSYTTVVNRPILIVTPLFQSKYAKTELTCMLSVRLGQTIYAFMYLLRRRKQYSTEWKKNKV